MDQLLLEECRAVVGSSMPEGRRSSTTKRLQQIFSSVVGWERGLVRLRLVVHNSTICHFVFKYFPFLHMSVPVCPRVCVCVYVCVVSSLLSTDCDICISIDSSAGDGDECWTLARARMKNRLHSRSHSHWYSHWHSHSHAAAAADAVDAAVGCCCCFCCLLWLFHTFHRLISLGGAAN